MPKERWWVLWIVSSLYYSGRFCVKCVRKYREEFPKELSKEIGKLNDHYKGRESQNVLMIWFVALRSFNDHSLVNPCEPQKAKKKAKRIEKVELMTTQKLPKPLKPFYTNHVYVHIVSNKHLFVFKRWARIEV